MVGIVLGSKSDLELAEKAAEILRSLAVPYEVRVLSAHRSPAETASYAKEAEDRGVKVLIGVAGLSAALPGVLAAHTRLPVIGVPASGGALNGLDALLSISQMPSGVPVAATTIGSGGARNAALLACRILALSDNQLAARLYKYMEKMRDGVLEADGEVGSSWRPDGQ